MTALELMAACRSHGQEIARLEETIEELEAAATSFAAPLDTPGGAPQGDRFGGYAARRDELERRRDECRRALAAEQMAVILLTGEMPDAQRGALKYFYCYGLSAAQTAQKLHCSVSGVYKAMAAAKAALTAWTEEAVADKLPGWYTKQYCAGAEE